MNMIKLTKSKFAKLFREVFSGTANYGTFIFGKYKIGVWRAAPMSNSERVKLFWKRHPEKLIENYHKKKLKYRHNKRIGLCVKCSKKATHGIVCEKCYRGICISNYKRRKRK